MELPFKVLLFWGSMFFANIALGQLLINEFQASNSTTIEDPDFHESSDWIELYNSGSGTFDLSGHYLTDNLGNPDKWAFPSISIGAGQYLLIFASGEDIRSSVIWSTVVDQGDPWKYLIPSASTSSQWYLTSYEDAAWSLGPSGFGYGDGDDATSIPPGTISVYLRKSVYVESIENIERAMLHVDYDDAFVAYLNGHEIARGNLGNPGDPVSYNTVPQNDHEAQMYSGDEPDRFEIGNIKELIISGDNLLAIEIHNVGSGSSDLTMIPFFSLGYSQHDGNPSTNELLNLPGSALHTNFKLAAEGEEIGIFSPNLVAIDTVSYGQQSTDISLGRNPSSSSWLYYTEPTPGASNSSFGYSDFTRNTVDFSVQGGFFNSTMNVELSTYLGGEIKYTLDGSIPVESSPAYAFPIEIQNTSVLRARIFNAGLIPGPTITHTYFFQTSHNLPVISIVTDSANFWDSQLGIYVQDFKPDWEVPINIEMFENHEGNRAAFNERAGTKINGLRSWRLPQKMLGIYFRNQYGSGKLDYQLFFDRSRNKFDDFALRQSGSDWSYTFFRDILGQELMAMNSDVATMGYRTSVVYLNGEYLGIHNIRSKVNEDYIIGNYNRAAGTFDLIENETTIEAGNLAAYIELQHLLSEDLSDESNFLAVASSMDIENFTDYMIAEMYVRNTSIGHNVMAWKPKEGGKWQWILMDLDRGFFSPESRLIDYFMTKGTVPFRELMASPVFVNQFAHRLADHLITTYHPGNVSDLVDSHREMLNGEMPRQVQRWQGTTSSYGDAIPSMEYWLAEVEDLKEFAIIRPSALLNDLNNYGFANLDSLRADVLPAGAGKLWLNDLVYEPGSAGQHLRGAQLAFVAQESPGYNFVGWTMNDSDFINYEKEMNLELVGSTSLIAVFETSEACTVPTIISSDLTLGSDCSTYLAIGDIQITSGNTLTIEAGVTLQMPEETSIIVNGKLLIEGSDSQKVRIEGNPNNDKSWGAIVFLNSSDTSKLENLIIEEASIGPVPSRDKAAISVFNADLIMDHITIENVENNPIFSQYGDVLLLNSKLHSSVSGDLINVKYGTAHIRNTDFHGNDQPDTDGIDYDEVIGGTIINCVFHDFNGLNSDGIDIGEQAVDILIDSIIAYNITDKGVSVGQQSKVTITNSLFSNSNMGVAVKDSSYVSIDHCTFYNTSQAVACYEKNPGKAGGNASVTNSIISNSPVTSYYVDSKSKIFISHSLSDTNPLTDNDSNLQANPYFTNPTFYRFSPQSNSPVKAAGTNNTDLGSPLNIISASPNVMIGQIFPDIMNTGLPEFIALVNPSDESIDLSNYRITKGIVYEIPQGTFLAMDDTLFLTNNASSTAWPSGKSVMEWSEGKLANEGEKIQIENKHGIIIDYLEYDIQEPWPQGEGIFTLKADSLDNHFGENWMIEEDNRKVLAADADLELASMSVYPNPAFDNITVVFPQIMKSDIEIFNISGELMLSNSVSDLSLEINISSLPTGLYIVKCDTELLRLVHLR